MATATTNGSSTVLKPDHEAGRKHFIFTQEHEDLRESMQAWVKKELHPHRNEWEETTFPDRSSPAPASWASSASASRRSTAARAATTTTRWSAPSA